MERKDERPDRFSPWSYDVVPSRHAHAHVDRDGDAGRVGQHELGLGEEPLLPPHLGEEGPNSIV